MWIALQFRVIDAHDRMKGLVRAVGFVHCGRSTRAILYKKGFAFSQAFSGPGRSRQDTLTTLDSLQVYPATLSNATQVTFRCNSS